MRLRRLRGAARQQTKWFAFGAIPWVAVDLTSGFLPPFAGGLGSLVALSGLLGAITVAVFRYQLYDIDRLLNRTLVYALLTAILGTGYAALVLVFGQLLGRDRSSLGVAAATLVVAALFQPLRRRIQAAVDRRFDRRRYDAAQTIEQFSARLRQEVDLDALTTELLAVVDRTMQPTAVSLWLRHRQGQGSGDAATGGCSRRRWWRRAAGRWRFLAAVGAGVGGRCAAACFCGTGRRQSVGGRGRRPGGRPASSRPACDRVVRLLEGAAAAGA
jgi:hypothetical protein